MHIWPRLTGKSGSALTSASVRALGARRRSTVMPHWNAQYGQCVRVVTTSTTRSSGDESDLERATTMERPAVEMGRASPS